MEPSRPSRTALRVALRRAAHQLYDSPPLVLEDPIAVPILGPHAEELSRTPGRAAHYRRPGNNAPQPKERAFSIALRAFLIARSRYAEDQLAKAVASGVTQYVLLGAGLDTFAHRNHHPHLRIFEVDHPATQQWKRELLASTALPTPSNLTYAPIDFETQTLPTQLNASGFDPTQPSFFAWLGVVPYLTLTAFRSTVAFIAAQPPGSGLVFDYGQPRHALPLLEQLAHDSLSARVKLAGEPFQLFFTPREVAAELDRAAQSSGTAFYNLEDLGTPEINALYFDQRAAIARDNLRILGSAGCLLSAWL